MTVEPQLQQAKALVHLIEAMVALESPILYSVKSEKLWVICDQAVKKFMEEFTK